MIFKKKEELKTSALTPDYWNDHWPKAPIIYSGRALRLKSDRINIDVKTFITSHDEILRNILIKYKLIKPDPDATMLEIQKWVVRFLRYVEDTKNSGVEEFWKFPFETVQAGIGDCVSVEEEIYVKNGIKKIKDLVVNDEVLSYDFEKKEYCYKPVTKIWEKGKLPLKRVHIRNGQFIDVTDNHPFWSRTNQQKVGIDGKYEKTLLKDIDLNNTYKRKIPFVKELPYEIKDIDWLTEDLCFVIGHYLAEGSKEKNESKLSTSGYDLYDEIFPKLDEANIPYSEFKNNHGIPCARFLKSDFKDYLKKFKANSFNIHIPEEIFHLPKNKLQALLNGIILGDGYYDDRKIDIKYNRTTNRKFVIYTSCEQFAKDIQRIGLQLGTSFGVYQGGNRRGWGKNLTWTINMNSNSMFYRDYGYQGMSEISISYIEDMKKEVEMRDFEVADTHTFIFKNGAIGHNCEDGAILIAALAINAGIPSYRVKVAAGFVQEAPTAPQGGHAYCIYLASDNLWRICDWCYFEDSKIPMLKKPLAKDGGQNKAYKDVWFTFNDQFSWNQKALAIGGRVSVSSEKEIIDTNAKLSNIMKEIDKQYKAEK